MQFIETLFGFAPDNGDGSLEMLLFLTPLVAVAIIWSYRRTSRR